MSDKPIVGDGKQTNSFIPDAGYMDEDYRPQFHYTAEKNMINDPNGLVYYEGQYHLFHQYNLFDAIHWGHAVSSDLVHWQHLPPALFPDSIGQIWSGTIAVDHGNTSGLQDGPKAVLVAAFTYSQHKDGLQSQGLAYSNDGGTTWKMHPDNPVVPNPGKIDFRDPKIFWHPKTNRWVMLVTAGGYLDFYTAPDLKNWTYASSWGSEHGAHGGSWECPDLFEIGVAGTTKKKWILSVSVGGGAPAGGSGMQYFIGEFDGRTFVNDNGPDLILWQNYGQDYYAGITWANVPEKDGRLLMIAWLDNWLYRFDVPTSPFNGQLSIVRELILQAFPQGLRLVQNPVTELQKLRLSGQHWANQIVTPVNNLLSNVSGEALEIIAEFEVKNATATEFGIEVHKGERETTLIGYNTKTFTMFVDRTNSGIVPSAKWSGRQVAPLTPLDGKVILHFFVDRSSVEVFGNAREQISSLILPHRDSLGLATFATGGNVLLKKLSIYKLARIWNVQGSESGNIRKWQTVSGQWATTQMGREGSADGYGLTLGEIGGSNFSFSATIKILGALKGNPRPIKKELGAGLVFRASNTAQRGYQALINYQTQRVELDRVDALFDESYETLASTEIRIQTDTEYEIKVVAKEGNIRVLVDGLEVLQANDECFNNGLPGLFVKDCVAIFSSISFSLNYEEASD